MKRSAQFLYKQFFKNYADSLVGEDPMVWGDIYGFVPFESQKHITRVMKDEKVTIDGKQFPSKTFELIEVENVLTGKNKGSRIIKIVLAHEIRKQANVETQYPYIVIYGYVNETEDFDNHLADFNRFLNQVRLNKPETDH